ncbi:hypothetical protein [Enterococcus sp. AZ109]|uniref:hypothetical protein n=1 Tax=Enterococcus sp. AZ109 TaxID=2774634 RepID=UPI003F2867A0
MNPTEEESLEKKIWNGCYGLESSLSGSECEKLYNRSTIPRHLLSLEELVKYG